MKKVGSEVYSLPVFKKDFTKNFLEELQHFKLSGIHHEQPNSMNRHGIILDEIGFKSFFDLLRIKFIQPLAQKVFQNSNLKLDSHRAFVVKYAMNEDLNLSPHFDNAEITLNVALSEHFEDGELIFHNEKSSIFGYEHEFGRGLIHRYSFYRVTVMKGRFLITLESRIIVGLE